jgi:hypothetical protein
MAKLPTVGYLVSQTYAGEYGPETENRGCFKTRAEADAYAAKLGTRYPVTVVELDLVERRAYFRAMGERAGRSFWKSPIY